MSERNAKWLNILVLVCSIVFLVKKKALNAGRIRMAVLAAVGCLTGQSTWAVTELMRLLLSPLGLTDISRMSLRLPAIYLRLRGLRFRVARC